MKPENFTIQIVQVIKATDLQSGDTIVISHPARLSVAGYEQIVASVKANVPKDVKILLLGEGMTVEGVLRFGSEAKE